MNKKLQYPLELGMDFILAFISFFVLKSSEFHISVNMLMMMLLENMYALICIDDT